MILYDFINCPAFVEIKKTLHYKLAINRVNIIRETFVFYALFLMFFCIPSLDKVL